MVIGYKIQCTGFKEPILVRGENFDECVRKFRNYYENDYDIDTDEITFVEAIAYNFDIE